ncbi:MAG: sugar phosphate isomerase/epimerase, partial [Bacteroidetes bacterium]|nr:sugar phosphate isomerase/epimerase [Bacteroidota bacterium]
NWFKSRPMIGLQLYTLREEIKKGDLGSVISKVAQTGYTTVELFGYDKGNFFGKSPEEFALILKNNNLKTPSGHYVMNDFLSKGDTDQLKQTVADAAKMGHDFFVIPYLMDTMRTSLDDYHKLAEKINVAATEVKKAGMRLAYHNHDFEFKDWGGGKTGMDIFLKETDADNVNFEMDIYWTTKAGKDPIALFKANPGRFKMWHVKDMANTPEKEFTEVGSGVINYKEIFKHKKESGMEYFFVEQDQVKIPVYESISKSFNYIKANLVS